MAMTCSTALAALPRCMGRLERGSPFTCTCAGPRSRLTARDLSGSHKPCLEARYVSAQPPQRVVMTHLIRNECTASARCEAKEPLALIVADEHREMQCMLLRDLVVSKGLGTWGYLGKRITRVISTIHFVDSQTEPTSAVGWTRSSFIEFRHLADEEEPGPSKRTTNHHAPWIARATDLPGGPLAPIRPRSTQGPAHARPPKWRCGVPLLP